MFPIRILATTAVAVIGAAGALGQGCDTPGGCGNGPVYGTGALFAPNKHHQKHMPDANHPLCATKTYPLSDWHYIRQFCGPTLNPGSCYGHYQTKWRQWSDICPQGSLAYAPSPVATGLPSYQVIMPDPTPAPMPLPAPTPLPKTESPKVDPAPKTEPKLNFAPESPLPIPMTFAPAPLPPMTSISATIPAPVGTLELRKIAAEPGVAPLKTLPNVVVPPVREFPERSRN